MADDAEQGWWRRSLVQLRRTVTVLVFAAGFTIGAGAMLYSKSEDLQHQQQHQSAQIEQLEARVHALEQFAGEGPPAVCRCQKAAENGLLLQRFCLAKNAICDEESARICQAQLPGYQC
ncbi:MAG: hypothetical protein ACOY3E_03960 [Pseudomonadota bacterium]